MAIEALTYQKHMNLKLASIELGITLQTLYARLRKQGVKVIGDKSRYGTAKDRLGAHGEALFMSLVPNAKNMNGEAFQAKHDFTVGEFKIDVKASKPNTYSKSGDHKRWAFAFKKQTYTSDFHVCFCLNDNESISRILLVPTELVAGIQTVSVSLNGRSKWLDYEVPAQELTRFFAEEVAA